MYLHEASHGGQHRHKLAILCEQQNHRCCYCGIRFVEDIPNHPRLASIEHVTRLCEGGKRNWRNEVAACRWCNSGRGALPATVFFETRSAVLQPPIPLTRRQKINRKRKRRRYIRVWQNQMAIVGHDVALGSFKEVWPQIERRVA